MAEGPWILTQLLTGHVKVGPVAVGCFSIGVRETVDHLQHSSLGAFPSHMKFLGTYPLTISNPPEKWSHSKETSLCHSVTHFPFRSGAFAPLRCKASALTLLSWNLVQRILVFQDSRAPCRSPFLAALTRHFGPAFGGWLWTPTAKLKSMFGPYPPECWCSGGIQISPNKKDKTRSGALLDFCQHGASWSRIWWTAPATCRPGCALCSSWWTRSMRPARSDESERRASRSERPAVSFPFLSHLF